MKKVVLHGLHALLFLVCGYVQADDLVSNLTHQREVVASTIGVDQSEVKGSLTKDQIAQVIAKFMGQIGYCYERQLQKEPTISGEVRVHFMIDKLGKVATASTLSSTMKNKTVESCINGVFGRMSFPPFDHGFVEATYPLVFNLVKKPIIEEEKIVEKGIPAPKPVEASIPQDLPIKNEISKVIQSSMGEFDQCYQQGVKDNPTLRGKVIVWAVIGPKGNVTNVNTKYTTLNYLTTELCLNYQFSRLKFPEASANKVIEVNYPFYFGIPQK
jgi:hypothetical protein